MSSIYLTKEQQPSSEQPYNSPGLFNGGDMHVPIDPALAPVIDPALTNGAFARGMPEPDLSNPLELLSEVSSRHARHYSQGPQGDPFAQQLPPDPFFSPPPALTPIKPKKNKRKPRREEECSFCGGNDLKNKQELPEPMLSCEDCGRSGHPSCMELEHIAQNIYNYPWQCNICKACTVCHKKSDDDDSRILLCDHCDRGWHMDCLDTPLEEPPEGQWHCPACPPYVPPPPSYSAEMEVEPDPPPDVDNYHLRGSSVASSSHSVPPPTPSPHPRKGKARATDSSDVDAEDVEAIPIQSLSRSSRVRRPPHNAYAEATFDEDVPAPTPLRPPKPKPKRNRPRASSPPHAGPKRVRLTLRQKDDDDAHKGLFDDILRPEDRDVSWTTISSSDKARFERSRTIAERKAAPPPHDAPDADRPLSFRPLRSAAAHAYHATLAAASPAPSSPGPRAMSEEATKQRIQRIRFGEYDIQTWYDAPFPEEYANLPEGRLWLCEFCLKYMKSGFVAQRHKLKCKVRHPPGDEIYRDGAVSMFEIDGRKNKIYCQNLCLLSKMFLDHKSLFYDVEPFLFYVMTESDNVGARFVGYFSKEKRSPKDYNVSCIMTLPVRQRRGWGNLLIDFSYLLSRTEQRIGSPEKPLSGLGALGYRNYWTLALMRFLATSPENPRLEEISSATSMTIEDVCNTLKHLGMITLEESTPPPVKPAPGQSIKKGPLRKSGAARRALQRADTGTPQRDGVEKKSVEKDEPFVPPSRYQVHWDPARVSAWLEKWTDKGYLVLRPDKLKWSPFLIARTRKTDGAESLPAPIPPADSSLAPTTPTPTPAPDLLPEPAQAEQPPIARAPSSSPPPDLFADDTNVVIASASRTPGRESAQPAARAPDTSGDLALAASLALEEESRLRRPFRRTRSSTLNAAPGGSTPRKRRRMDSSSDVEMSPPPAPNGNGIKANGVDVVPEAVAGADGVKYEDADTPATLAVGRQSIPSDATIVGEGGVMKGVNGIQPIQTTEDAGAAHTEDEEDVDADGETDAEGEDDEDYM